MDTSWQNIYITTDNAISYIVDHYSDTATIYTFHNYGFFSRGKKTTDTSYTKLTESEKDTLYNIVNRIITYPVKPTHFCTDYVGDLHLSIRTDQIDRSIRYNSTCDWWKLSPDTKKLAALLQRYSKN